MKSKAFGGPREAASSKGMRYKAGILLLPLVASLIAFAQTDPDAPIMSANALERQGQPAGALALLQPLIDSGAFQGAELGRAWTVLGVSYGDQNDFREARHAYEAAISILQAMPEDIRDYAAAVNKFAGLYRAEGQLQVSTDLRLKALRLYQQAGDHSGIVRASSALAGLALQQGHIREGQKYLKQTAEEMKVATGLTGDDLATIYSTQARYATVHGDTSAAIAGYEHSLQILKGVHDVNNPVLGWEYLLLGIAYADANRFEDALREMRQGLSTLDRTWGRKDSRYLEAEIAYSQVLDRSGDHKPAALLRAADEATLKDLQRTKCAGCTISADAFR
jgi:tetratricopeptide (TPR) repeat protein